MKKNYFLIMIVLGFCSCQKEASFTAARTAEATVDRFLDILTDINNATAKEEVMKWASLV